MTGLAIQNKIDTLEDAMREMPNQIDVNTIEVKHYTTNSGLYAREMIIPAGVKISGKIKKHEHISVLSAGFVTEVTNAGIQHIRAPYTMVSQPGTKRVVIAHETTVWTTVHATDTTDIDKLEDELIAATYDDVPALVQQFQLDLEDLT